MKKAVICLILALSLAALSACSGSVELMGFYQSDMINGEVVQISVDSRNGLFHEYISSRLVNSGSYVKNADGTYTLSGDEASYTVSVAKDVSIKIAVPGINGGDALTLKQVSTDRSVFSTIDQSLYTDADAYRLLLSD